MKRITFLLFLSFSLHAWAAEPRTLKCDFDGENQDKVYRVMAAVEVGTTFRLPEGWKVADFVVTDPKSFHAESNGTIGIVTPLVPDKTTSVSIFTENEKLFVFSVSSQPSDYADQLVLIVSRNCLAACFVRISIRASTLSSYTSINQKHLVPFFAKTGLQDISFETVQDFVIYLREDFSPKMVRNCFGLLRTMLAGRKGKTALRQGFISHDPTQGVELPCKDDRAIFPLAGDGVWRLIHAAEEIGPKEQAFVYLGAHTGARRGELLGFRYTRINWNTGQLLIDQAVRREKGTDGVHKWVWKLGPPKTRKSVRKVILSPDVLDYLKRMQANSAGSDFIFAGSRPGEFMDPDLLDVMFAKVRSRANLPHHVRFHDLRHYFASFLIEQGLSAEYVRDQLGHSSIQVTFDVYGHLFEKARQEAPARLQQGMEAFKNLNSASDSASADGEILKKEGSGQLLN